MNVNILESSHWIHGDYEDLNALHSALSDYLRFYFAHQDDVESSSCYENILGLCYDIRHAYQGDRNIESVDNNYENIGQLASCIFSVDSQSLQKERNKPELFTEQYLNW